MSIKTNELQQMTSILGTDSLLADTAAAGTGRVSAVALAQFMDQELLKPGTALSTALSNKAALSVQQTVEATNLPSRTVEVAAEDLPAYINSLPRLLMADITIKVTGTLTEFLYIHRFSGSGSISIDGNGDCRLQGGVSIRSSSAVVVFRNLEFSLRKDKMQLNDIVDIQFSGNVSIRSCSVAGSESANTEGEVGVRADYHSCAALINCGISNCRIAVISAGSTIVSIYNENRGDFSGNAAGPYVFRGGIILLGGSTPELLGGATSAKVGGLIVKGDGTLL